RLNESLRVQVETLRRERDTWMSQALTHREHEMALKDGCDCPSCSLHHKYKYAITARLEAAEKLIGAFESVCREYSDLITFHKGNPKQDAALIISGLTISA